MSRWTRLAPMTAALALASGGFAQLMSPDSPQVGDPLPAVSGFDADGSRFEMTRLEGKHAVIVFGCLT